MTRACVRRLLPTALAALLLLAACGGGGGGDSNDDSDSTATTPTTVTTAAGERAAASPSLDSSAPTLTAPDATPSGVAPQDTPTQAGQTIPPSVTSDTDVPPTAAVVTPEPTLEPTPVPSATDYVAADPVMQSLVAALPPTGTLFPPGWSLSVQENPDDASDVHCRLNPSMVFAAALNGGTPTANDDVEDAIGPAVQGIYQDTVEMPDAIVGVMITDMTAAATYVPNAAQVVVDAYVAAAPCEVNERDLEVAVAYSAPEVPFAVVGDGGQQWTSAISATQRDETRVGYALVFAVGDRLVTVAGLAVDPAALSQPLLESVALAVTEGLR